VVLDPEHRPSRRGWPLRTGEATTTAGTHDHLLPAWLPRVVIAQSVAILVLGVTIGALLLYILGRGAFRDEQTQMLNERINAAVCDLLDQLPEGGLLERPRERYHCGPGIPLEELPPDQADRLREQRGENPPTVTPSQTPAAPPTGADPMAGATATRPYSAPTYGPPD
jgi:hypothetical protein